jgi:hypothetical protein
MTYLNGGGLVAIPTAVALFQADVKAAKLNLIIAALLFVSGLVLVTLTQLAAFFTLARRSEAERLYENENIQLLNATHFLISDQAAQSNAVKDAQRKRQIGHVKERRSDRWRLAAIVIFYGALLCFIVGCYFGTGAVLS